MQQARATTAATLAQARKTDAEATVLEAEVPYSAANARSRSFALTDTAVKLGQEVEKLSYDIKSAKLNVEQLEQMQPLLLQAQRLVNAGLREGLSRKELESNVAETLNIPFRYAGEAIKYLNQLGSEVGQEAADAADWFKSLPSKWREWREENGRRDRSNK